VSQKPATPVVSFVPAITDLKLDENYKRIWRVEYRWKTELRGWTDAVPFVFTLRVIPNETPQELQERANSAAFILAAARCPRGAIAHELTAVKLSSPLTNKRD
jgi:hypothetical protein